MNASKFSEETSPCLIVDSQMRIIDVLNLDKRLFFGRNPLPCCSILDAAGEVNSKQADIIMSGISRAFCQKRNTCFEYLSVYAEGPSVNVGVYIDYRGEDRLYLYLNDLNVEQKYPNTSINTINKRLFLHESACRYLPVGVAIYSKTGLLIDINDYAMKIMGMKSDKDDMVGVINIFDNPNFPLEIRDALLSGQDLNFVIDYDFDILEGYYETTNRSIYHIEYFISTIRDSKEQIEEYIVVLNDVTSRVKLEQRYENLYNQNEIMLNTLPVGVALYSNGGDVLYVNQNCMSMFGVEPDEVIGNSNTNIYNSPIIPKTIKDAVRSGIPIEYSFPYNFGAVDKLGHYETTRDSTVHLDCSGRPIINSSGKMDGYVFIMSDMTDKLQKEQELNQVRMKIEMSVRAADIMLWEFDVKSKLFYSYNDPINEYNELMPIPFSRYLDAVHSEDRAGMCDSIKRMGTGEDFLVDFNGRISIYEDSNWQYCTMSGSPYEYDLDGKVSRYVGIRKNNTELHKKKLLQDKILNSIPLSIHIKDVANDYRYVFCNDESRRMFDSSEDKTSYDIMDVEDVERIRKTDFETFSTGKPYVGYERIALKDGRNYDTIVRKSIIDDGGKRLLLTTRWDRSDQNDLMRRSKLLAVTMESMNAFTWFFDPVENRVSYGEGYDKVDRKASDINTPEKYAKSLHPDDREMFIDSLTEAIERESGEWNIEYRIDLNGNGVYQWWQTRGIIEVTTINDAYYKYMFGMTICIDNHKQIELTLLKNKEELNDLIYRNELIINNTNSGLAYISSDYIVQWENISSCSASISYEAYKEGEYCYKSAHNRTTPCDNCVLDRTMKSKQMEKIKFCFEGNYIVEIFATPVFDDNNSVQGIVIRVDDVTERERMIEELKQAKAQAEQSDKLKSAFLANMSHEIRTPLNAITGFSELLIHCDDDERDEYVQIISTNNELLLKLINDILDLSKIEAGSVELKYEEFDLSPYFDDLAVSMGYRINNPKVNFAAINPYSSCIVSLDRNRIAQILTNYLTNAIKYTPSGSVETGYRCGGDYVYIYVKDSGIGIPDDKKNKVFHRFEKLDEFAQGTGLGLSICKAITESMGGEVGFESNYGEGSLFWAKLPCSPKFQLTSQIDECVDSIDSGQNISKDACLNNMKTILVAEDIMSNYIYLSEMLKDQFNLLHAINGKEAVEMVRYNDIDLLFMDMKMPVMNGLDTTLKIREFNNNLPIIALTAHAFELDRKAALNAGCNDYLVKPIIRDDIMNVLRKHGLVSDIEK